MKKNNFNFFILLTNIIPSIFICIFLFWLLFNIEGTFGKIIFLPFVLCGSCSFWQIVARIMGNHKLEKLFNKLYMFIFLMYWFGILTIGIYSSIIYKNYGIIPFTIPFIVVGLYVGYKFFIKKK